MIKNDKQVHFNQVKGELIEINLADDFCNIVLRVGLSNERNVCLSTKTEYFKNIFKDYKIGDKLIAQFYIVSNKKSDRWYTTAYLLDLVIDYNSPSKSLDNFKSCNCLI